MRYAFPPRPRVRAAIERALTRRLALIVAPAGSGKSLALLEAIEGTEYVSLSVEPQTTLLGLLRGLAEAIAPNVPGDTLAFGLAHERALQAASPVPGLVEWFAGHIRDAAALVVLEDLHHAEHDQAALEFLVGIIEATSPYLRWAVTTRSANALPLASWLAHGLTDLPIDDETLRFRFEEIEALLEAVPTQSRREIARTMLQTTGGWGAGVAVAATALSELGALVPHDPAHDDESRCRFYETVARRIIERQPQPVRTFLLSTSVYDGIEPTVLGSSESHETRILHDLAVQMPFLVYRRDGLYRYDGHFARTLRALLAEDGLESVSAAYRAASCRFEAAGRAAEALSFATRAGDAEAVDRLLTAHGVLFMDQGKADVVQSALSSLHEAGNAAITGLRAMVEALHGRLDTAEAWFRLAIESADERLRPRLVYRYALDLVRRGRDDAIALLEPLAAAELGDADLEVSIAATLGTAYAMVERFVEARAASERAVERAGEAVSVTTRARVFHQASFVAVESGDYAHAATFARRAIEIALADGLYDIAARAYTVLYVVAYTADDNLAEAVACVDRSAELSLKAGDARTHLWSLLAAYYLEAQRGRAEALERIGRALHPADIAENQTQVDHTLLPAQALRAAWRGQFEHAYHLLAPTAGRQLSAARLALRWAEIGLYAAAAGMRTEARTAVASALSTLRGIKPEIDRDGTEATVYAVLALMLLGRGPVARTALDEMKARAGQQRPPSLDALVDATCCTLRYWDAVAPHSVMVRALDRLRAHDLAGIAMLFEALPRPRSSDSLLASTGKRVEPEATLVRPSRLKGL
jgi:LuxR family maltose regulon positive regulatory protein